MARGDDNGGTNTSRRVSPKVVVIAVLVILLVWWALVNSQSVTVDWIVTDTTTPLVFVIAASALVGLLAGYVLSLRRNRGE